MIKIQFGTEIKRIRTDNAKDFFNQTLFCVLQKQGIIHESSYMYTPQQNGVAERKNGHLLVVTRSLLFHSNVPKHYWGEATLTTTYLINRLPFRSLNSSSPIQLLFKFFPDFKLSNGISLKMFGCMVFVQIIHLKEAS